MITAALPELKLGILVDTLATPSRPVVTEYICGLKAVPRILIETAAWVTASSLPSVRLWTRTLISTDWPERKACSSIKDTTSPLDGWAFSPSGECLRESWTVYAEATGFTSTAG